MITRELFGITAQPISLFYETEKKFVICKHDTEKLTYWNREKRLWLDSIFEATIWPEDKEGQIPYLANNVYSCFEGFTAKNYKLVGISQGLYPCAIKYYDLYLKSYNEKSIEFSTDCGYENCIWIQGPYKALDIMWELVTLSLKNTGAKNE